MHVRVRVRVRVRALKHMGVYAGVVCLWVEVAINSISSNSGTSGTSSSTATIQPTHTCGMRGGGASPRSREEAELPCVWWAR